MSETSQSLLPGARAALDCVLDELIPRSDDGRLPGAGELGVAVHVDALVQRTPALRPLIAQGLASLDERARGAGAASFAALPKSARAALLSELAAALPAFVPTLLFLSYTGYYREPRVMQALGLDVRPPFPKGYEVAPTDFAALERVRARGKIYRDC